MGTTPYIKAARSLTEYPLVTFAKSIGKNTAELDGRDLKKFLKWLWKTEPYANKRWQPVEAVRYFGKKGIAEGKIQQNAEGKLGGAAVVTVNNVPPTRYEKFTPRKRTRLQQQTTHRHRE